MIRNTVEDNHQLSGGTPLTTAASTAQTKDDGVTHESVRLAPAQSPIAVPRQGVESSPTWSDSPRAVRILIADDSEVNRLVALGQLRRVGLDAVCVPGGSAAVEEALTRPYDLILMDCQMPDMDGYEATAAIRAAEANLRHTPIVALSANSLDEDDGRWSTAGMDDYLTKPVSLDALRAVLERWLPAFRGSL